jgi:LacI family transcriptional regulator, galactose operon repressor
MSDVAAASGVSTTTVSMVLSGKAGTSIPTSTQERVLDASRNLGYRANAVARNLRIRTSDTIGLVSDVIASTPFAGAMIHGAHQAAQAAGKLLLIVDTDRDADIETKAIDTLHDRQVDAIIYATMYHRVIEPPASLREAAWVVLDSRTEDPADSWVVPDEAGGAAAATRHLIEQGHRRIGYLRDSHHNPADIERLAGYRRTLDEAGVAFDPELVVEDLDNPFGGHAAAARLLRLADPPTAIQCYNDRMAMGAYRAVRHAGLSIPGDLSVVGFDNQSQIAPWLDPPLTTVQLPHEAMGRWAVEHVVGVLGGEIEGPRQRRMECPLVVRESVTPPRHPGGTS